jgi:quercetin dioxygenase-like cupin family protein
MKKFLIAVALIGLSGSALAQDAMTMVKPDALTWKDNPALPKGGQIAILVGNPTTAGSLVVQRTKLPANYIIPPHTHPYAETVTVISGSLGFGMGEKFDTTKGESVKAGALQAMPARHAHYLWTGGEEAIIQVQFVGPAAIDYVDPADDPRKKTQ